jgi:hypothetical protein
MRPSHHNALDRWLHAERDEHPEAADEALFELFEALPLIAPPAGFADRVLLRAGLRAAAKRSFFASPVARLVVALCLVALSLGALWLPPVLKYLAGLWSFGGFFGGVVRGGVYALTLASEWLGSAIRVWDVVWSIASAITEVLTVPQVTAGLLVCLIVSSLAFRFLRDQISGERNWTYVDRI